MPFFTEEGATSGTGDQERFFHLHDLGSNTDIWQQGVVENFFIPPISFSREPLLQVEDTS